MWKKIDMVENPPCYLDPNDVCYYAREYIVGGGYAASQANQLMFNLKKKMALRDEKPSEFHWKKRAMIQFANEIETLLPEGATIATIPTSKHKDDADYDPRLDVVLGRLHQMRDDLVITRPISCKTSHQAFHAGGTRSVGGFEGYCEWHGFEGHPPDQIILIDDMITQGAHFCACKRMIRQRYSGMAVIGAFWARAVWPDQPQADLSL